MNFIKKFFRFLMAALLSILGAAGWLLQTLLQMVTVLFLVCLAAGIVVLVKVQPELEHSREVAYDTLAQMKRDDFSMLSDTEIFDKDGKRIGLINAGHYEYVDIADISLNLQNAYIAQEDRRFKIHNGVDWIATARAGLALIKHKGEITQGGSTITQQIIKNTYLTQEQTFTRKMVEILLAPELEKTYSKADIMEFYCNTNFYGHQCYGVQAASRYYFGKDASELEIYEAAVLVGLSNSPATYDPITHPEAALRKRNEVLKSMLQVNMLTQEQYAIAANQPLSILQEQQEGTDDSYLTSYAIHCASLELMKRDGFQFRYTFSDKPDYDAYMERYTAAYNEKNDAIRNGGYKIYTSLDQNIQDILQTHLDEVLSSYTELQENGKYALQGAAAIVDNQTNYVVAIVGGRGTDDQFNRAYLSARQPGSTIKPLIDYGPAFDTGEYYPSRIINDHQWENGPSNDGNRYYGPVTVREALNRSLNTVAWQVLEDIGVDTGLSYLDSMQFQKLTYVDNGVASLSIGGFTNGVRIVDMAKGFSTLANNGIYNDRTCILRIEQEQEGNLTAHTYAVTKQVYTLDTAFMLTDVLKGTFTSPYGTGRSLGLSVDMPAAGKTGTTNSNKDTWFCGYTRYYTTAVWVGYDTPRAMPGIYGSTYAGAIWKRVMDQLHEGLEPWDWEQPETVVKDSYDPVTGARLHRSQQPVRREDAAELMISDRTEGTILAAEKAADPNEAVYFKTSNVGPGVSPTEAPSPSQSDTWSPRSVGPGFSSPASDNTGSSSVIISIPGPGTVPSPGSESGPSYVAPVNPEPENTELPQDSPADTPPSQAPALEEPNRQAPQAAQASGSPSSVGGVYIEPTARAGTNLVDYFSTSSELRAQQALTDKAQSKLLEELDSLITDFENNTIHSASDVYEIRQQYKEISEKLKQVQTGEDRKQFYERVESRWLDFSSIIDTMGDALRVYQEQQELLEKSQLQKAEEQAALDRKQREIQDRVTSFETALEMLENIQYQSPEIENLVTTAINKLGDLYGYTDAEPYRVRLDAAIRRIRSLPTQEEWNAKEEQQRSNAISQGVNEQQALYQTYLSEQYYWNYKQSYEAVGR